MVEHAKRTQANYIFTKVDTNVDSNFTVNAINAYNCCGNQKILLRVQTHAKLLYPNANLDLSTPKPCHFQDIPRSFPIPNLSTLGSFVFELCSKYISVKNALIDPVTLTSDLSTLKPLHLQDIPRSFPIPSLNSLGSYVFVLCCRQTDGTKHPMHADRHSRHAQLLVIKTVQCRCAQYTQAEARVEQTDRPVSAASTPHSKHANIVLTSAAMCTSPAQNRHSTNINRPTVSLL